MVTCNKLTICIMTVTCHKMYHDCDMSQAHEMYHHCDMPRDVSSLITVTMSQEQSSLWQCDTSQCNSTYQWHLLYQEISVLCKQFLHNRNVRVHWFLKNVTLFWNRCHGCICNQCNLVLKGKTGASWCTFALVISTRIQSSKYAPHQTSVVCLTLNV